VRIEEAIGSIEPQTAADLCYLQNVAAQCANISTLPSGLLQIKLAPFNFAEQISRGLDIEASYRTPLGKFFSGAPGTVSLRAMATNYMENLVDNGIDFPNDSAGTNTGNGPPSWTYRFSMLYDMDAFTWSLVGRGISDGVYDNNFIECVSACPASTIANRTINNNKIDGQFWVDTSLTYKFAAMGSDSEFQIGVQNVFNEDPVLVANGPTGNSAPSFPAANRTFYDAYGRTYRASLRFKF
jgi:outer membrane receptor protein involved in Fe transport